MLCSKDEPQVVVGGQQLDPQPSWFGVFARPPLVIKAIKYVLTVINQ